jgi:hypothetical protein
LHLDVLVPAFALGCIIKSDHLHGSAEYGTTNHRVSGKDPKWQALLDWGIKGGFMLLAGMALPPLQLGGMGLGTVIVHVIVITLLSNIGKCLPMAAYTTEASARERLALCVGMFPRGEVGIGVLLVSLEIFRQQNLVGLMGVQESMTIGGLSLALNLALTGLFIVGVIRLLESDKRPS